MAIPDDVSASLLFVKGREAMLASKAAKPRTNASNATMNLAAKQSNVFVPSAQTDNASPVRRVATSGRSWDFSGIPACPSNRLDPTSDSFVYPALSPLGAIQTQLPVGHVDDQLEREADRVADRVMRVPSSAVFGAATSPRSNHKATAKWAEEQKPQRKSAGSVGNSALDTVHGQLSSPGQPLDTATRSFMEPRFGQDFRTVRVHSDSQAIASAQALHARAFTVGRDIVFGAGQFAPATEMGRRLLAHELSHVVQQSQAGSVRIQRAPGSGYQCTRATVNGGKLIFSGSNGNVSVDVRFVDDLPQQTYDLFVDEHGKLTITLENGKNLAFRYSYDPDDRQTPTFFGYLESLRSKKIKLTVTRLQPGAGESTEGSGTGLDSGQDPTGSQAGSATKTTDTPGASTSGTPEQAPGTTPDTTQGTGSGSGTTPATPGTSAQGQGSPGGATSDYPAKLNSVLDATQVQHLTEAQSRELKAILDQMSPSDIERFKQFAQKKPGGDPEQMIKSLKLFMSAREQYDKQAPPPSTEELGDEAQQALAAGVAQYRDDMTPKQKEELARSTIATVSNKQLKHMTAKQIAEGIIRVDQQVASVADDMSKGIEQTINADSKWGKAAGIARTARGAAGFWALLSVAALIAAQFVPGLNVLVDVLAANALAAGMVVFASANAEQEFDTQAAAHAKGREEFAKDIAGGIEARNAKIISGAGLALSALGGIIKATPLGRGLKNVSKKLGAVKDMLAERAAGSLGAAKAAALENLEKFRLELRPYSTQVRQIVNAAVNRLTNTKGADFLKVAKAIPEFQQLLGADQMKAMEALSPAALEAAKDELLADLPKSADEFFNRLDHQVTALEAEIPGAATPEALTDALDKGLKALDPELPLALEAAGTEAKQAVVQARAGQGAAGEQPAAPQQEGGTPPQTDAPAPSTQPAPKSATKAKRTRAQKPGSQDLDPQRRINATASKEGLEKQLKDTPVDQVQREREIRDLDADLNTLKGQKKPIPETLKNDKDYRNLPKIDDVKQAGKQNAPRIADEMAIDNRLQALEALKEKLAKKNALTPEVADYLEWEEKQLTLRQEIEGSKDANVVDDTQIKQIEDVAQPAAEVELRKASASIKTRVRKEGPNYRAKKSVGHDEVIGKERWDAQQASDAKVRRVQKGKRDQQVKILDPLDTDHLVSLDRLANRPELNDFVRLYAKASQTIKDLMLEDLSDLGDIPSNLKRIRWDANNAKRARSWNDIGPTEMERFGYSADDVRAMQTLENQEMKTILDQIGKLTDKYRAILAPQ
jgi:hypothetical protein